MRSAGGVADDAGVEAEGLKGGDRKTVWKQPAELGGHLLHQPVVGHGRRGPPQASPQRAAELQP